MRNHHAGRLVDLLTKEIGAEPPYVITRDPVNFIRIDVEGMELDTLEGPAATIARFRLHVLVGHSMPVLTEFNVGSKSISAK